MSSILSIIVPAYNIEDYIEECVESIRNQSYINWELILIDDGSVDNTGQLCDEYQKKDKRIKSIHQVNKGVSAARNKGISLAKGDWLMFVDGDDYLLPDALDSYYNAIVKWNPDVIIANTIRRNDVGEDFIIHTCLKDEYIKYNGERIIQSGLWSMVFRKDIILNNGIIFDESLIYSEDSLFKYMVLNHVNAYVSINNPLYVYRWNPKSAVACTNYFKMAHYQFLAAIKYKEFNNSIEKKSNFKQALKYATRWVFCLGMKAIAKCHDKETINQIKEDYYLLYGHNLKSIYMINYWSGWYRVKFYLLSIRDSLFNL